MSGCGLSGHARAALRALVVQESSRPAQAPVVALVDQLRNRFGAGFVAALYYGSCRLQDAPEGLIDLHVIVEDAEQALGGLEGLACELLAPNVYYLEMDHEGETLRCKYAVLSLARFRRSCSRRAFHSYFWARYAQPLSVLGADEVTRAAVQESLVDALTTTLTRALPVAGDVAEGAALWGRALALCYNCELRPEGPDRSRALIDAQHDYFNATGNAVLAERDRVQGCNDAVGARLGWGLRMVWGKVVSLARLVKGLYTFDGGLDYAAWKLERHTGRRIEITDAMRRNPLRHLPPHLWRLWRDGSFR